MSNVTTCSITSCQNTGKIIRGWCRNHYYRWKIHGDPLAGRTRRGECAEYFWAHVDDETDKCIIWPFATRDGYGRLTIDGREDCAHVFACERHHGVRPDGWYAAAHAPIICHNRACFNYRHVSWKTYAENNEDKFLDGTHIRPTPPSNAKLTWEQVAEIRATYHPGDNMTAMGAKYGVSRGTIRFVIRGDTWVKT